MEEIELIRTPVVVRATLAYDLTLEDAPSQVQAVDQTMTSPFNESMVENCDPEVAAASSQTFWYTV